MKEGIIKLGILCGKGINRWIPIYLDPLTPRMMYNWGIEWNRSSFSSFLGWGNSGMMDLVKLRNLGEWKWVIWCIKYYRYKYRRKTVMIQINFVKELKSLYKNCQLNLRLRFTNHKTFFCPYWSTIGQY